MNGSPRYIMTRRTLILLIMLTIKSTGMTDCKAADIAIMNASHGASLICVASRGGKESGRDRPQLFILTKVCNFQCSLNKR